MQDDFINAFAGVNVLHVEAIGKVIDRGLAAAYQGMLDAGLSDIQAMQIIGVVTSELMSAMAPASK
jgi:hypothetical protein